MSQKFLKSMKLLVALEYNVTKWVNSIKNIQNDNEFNDIHHILSHPIKINSFTCCQSVSSYIIAILFSSMFALVCIYFECRSVDIDNVIFID